MHSIFLCIQLLLLCTCHWSQFPSWVESIVILFPMPSLFQALKICIDKSRQHLFFNSFDYKPASACYAKVEKELWDNNILNIFYFWRNRIVDDWKDTNKIKTNKNSDEEETGFLDRFSNISLWFVLKRRK